MIGSRAGSGGWPAARGRQAAKVVRRERQGEDLGRRRDQQRLAGQAGRGLGPTGGQVAATETGIAGLQAGASRISPRVARTLS